MVCRLNALNSLIPGKVRRILPREIVVLPDEEGRREVLILFPQARTILFEVDNEGNCGHPIYGWQGKEKEE